MIIHRTADPTEMFRAYEGSDLWLTTANSCVVEKNRELVMGAGHALQTARFFDPSNKIGLKAKLGMAVHKRVTELHSRHGLYPELKRQDNPYGYLKSSPGTRCYFAYGVLLSDRWPAAKLGLFQTKDNYNNRSSARLVEWSAKYLSRLMVYMESELGRPPRVDLPLPGAGLGGLDESEALDIMKGFEDNVRIWILSK